MKAKKAEQQRLADSENAEGEQTENTPADILAAEEDEDVIF